ncbi:MAG: hypothetical protein JSS02_27605, partial [Planctomycetes bacterium]|nr:hypothetical protein [Planctomycetota bacterium]
LSEAEFGKVHDDGIYAVTAKSLAETGEYRIISLPDEPVQQKYPVVFPAILSVIWRVWPDFPANIVPMKCVSLLAGAVFLALSYRVLREVSGISPRAAVVMVTICALAPATAELANSVMSELVFGVFSLLALLLVERALRPSASPWWGVASGLLAATAWWTRSVGIALVVALLVGLVWRRKGRVALQVALGIVLVVIPIKLWEAPASQVDRAYEYYVGYGDWFRHAIADVGPRFLVWVPIKNLGSTFAGLSGTLVPSQIDALPEGPFIEWPLLGVLLAGIVGVLLAIVGLAGRVWSKTPDIWALYLVCYLLVILYWPFPSPPRFFVPVLPLVLAASRLGMVRTGWFQSPAIGLPLAGLGAVLVLVLAGFSAVDQIVTARAPVRTERYRWIRENSQPEDVVASLDDPKCFLYTGRKAVLFAIPDVAPIYGSAGGFVVEPDSILQMLAVSRTKLVMLQVSRSPNILVQLARDSLATVRTRHPNLLAEQWRDDREGTVIYRVNERELQAVWPRQPGP